jgi:hypothetical protein
MPGSVIVLLVLLIASLPIWPYSTDWGYRPAGVLAVAIGLLLFAWWLRLFTPAGALVNGAPAMFRLAGFASVHTITALN